MDKENLLQIEIKDNGDGFDLTHSLKKGGLGLSQIETRIKKMKGVFRIKSKSNEGTSVYITVPVVVPDKK